MNNQCMLDLQAVKIALELKKHFVDSNQLDVTQVRAPQGAKRMRAQSGRHSADLAIIYVRAPCLHTLRRVLCAMRHLRNCV